MQLMEDAGSPEDLRVQCKVLFIAWLDAVTLYPVTVRDHECGWVSKAKLGSTSCKKPMRRVVCLQYCWCPLLSWASSIPWEVAEAHHFAPSEEGLPGAERRSLHLCCGSWAPRQLAVCQGPLWRRPRGTGASYLCSRHWWEQKTQILVPDFRAIHIFWLQSNIQHMNDYRLILTCLLVKSGFRPAGIYTS